MKVNAAEGDAMRPTDLAPELPRVASPELAPRPVDPRDYIPRHLDIEIEAAFREWVDLVMEKHGCGRYAATIAVRDAIRRTVVALRTPPEPPK